LGVNKGIGRPVTGRVTIFKYGHPHSPPGGFHE
jgi:hypothetical protein